MYDVAIVTTLTSVAVLTLIRILERKMLPSGFKRKRRFKLSLYCNGEDVSKIQEFLSSNITSLDNFSSKKLIENPEKSKVTSSFEYHRKKVMKNIYNEISKICEIDSISIQEIND